MKLAVKFYFLCSVLTFCVLILSGCGESDQYAKFSGPWEREDGNTIERVTYSPANNRLTIVRASTTSKNVTTEYIFSVAEGKDNKLAMPITSEETITLELGADNTLTISLYDTENMSEEVSSKDFLAMFLSDKYLEPDRTMHYSQSNKEHDVFFPSDTSSIDSLSQEWRTAESDLPVLSLDMKSRRLTILDKEFQKSLKMDVANVSLLFYKSADMLEVTVVSENVAEKRDKYMLFLEVYFKPSPPEARLFVKRLYDGETVIRSEWLTPKMSAADRAKYVDAKEKAAEAAAAEEKRLLEEREEAERQKLAEEAERQKNIAEAEAERQKQLAEKRANMPEFSFEGITLSDTPQQIIDKVLNKYDIKTSFLVQQSGNSIIVTKGDYYLSYEHLEGGPLLAEFLGHTLSGGVKRFHLKDLFHKVKNSGLRFDYISLNNGGKAEPNMQTKIELIYYTLPEQSPILLYVLVMGTIVGNDVPAVFTERYGEPDERGERYKMFTWLSDKGIAVVLSNDLYMVSKPAYEEITAYIKRVEAKNEEEEKAKEKARRANI